MSANLRQRAVRTSSITWLTFKYSPTNQFSMSDLAMHNDWVSPQCELKLMQHSTPPPKVPIKVSNSHTERQTLYCTILTIDLIIIFSSAPASPPLIFTTGTSITLMACKNQPAGSGCQTLAFERTRRRRWKKKRKDRSTKRRTGGWEMIWNKEKEETNSYKLTQHEDRGEDGCVLGMQEAGS